MDRRLEQKAAGDGFVRGPYRLQQFAAVHLDVRGMGRRIAEQLLHALVDLGEAVIVAHLEDSLRLARGCEQSFGVGHVGRHRLLAEDVLARGERAQRQLHVLVFGAVM